MIKQAYTVGNRVIESYIPKKTNARDLEALYDILNEIFADYSECFYTKDEVKKLKKDSTNIFLRGANNENRTFRNNA